MFKDLAERDDDALLLEIQRYIESLQGPDADESDLVWCQVAEARRTLEAIDPVFGAVLENPCDYADRDELTFARQKLRMLIRRARRAGRPLLASAWLPWLYTLLATDNDTPGLKDLGQQMWALIEPPYIQAEAGDARLTPPGYRLATHHRGPSVASVSRELG